jgi:type II secretory pathway component PulF
MQIALNLKKKQQLKKDLLNAALMPAFTVFFALLIVVIILLVVVPQFEMFFSSLGKKLPAATKIIVAISHFLASRWFLIWMGLFWACIFGLVSLLGVKKIKQFKDRFLISIPYFKNFIELSNFTYFLQAFSVLLKSGIPIKDAFICACDSMSNLYLKAKVKMVIQDITRGRTLSDAIALLPKFYRQENLVALIKVGEQTGTLSDVLSKVTESFQDELKHFVVILTSFFQPILLIIIGLIIGVMIWMIYLPIFNLAYSIS